MAVLNEQCLYAAKWLVARVAETHEALGFRLQYVYEVTVWAVNAVDRSGWDARPHVAPRILRDLRTGRLSHEADSSAFPRARIRSFRVAVAALLQNDRAAALLAAWDFLSAEDRPRFMSILDGPTCLVQTREFHDRGFYKCTTAADVERFGWERPFWLPAHATIRRKGPLEYRWGWVS